MLLNIQSKTKVIKTSETGDHLARVVSWASYCNKVFTLLAFSLPVGVTTGRRALAVSSAT